MKYLILILTIFISVSNLYSQIENPEYDSTLAQKVGADDWGMKSFIMVVLKTGKAQITDSVKRAEMFRGHFDNINKLAEAGKMVLAGPIGKNENTYRGIFVFDVATIEEAKELIKGDPTIVNGIFDVEFYKWYASAALLELNNIHKKISKQKP